jgi:hypothetical protein
VTNWIVSLTLWLFTYKIKGDNSVCHLCSHQTLLSKSLDAVQKEILYVKSHKVREIIQFLTDTRDLPSNVWWLYMWETELSTLSCDFLHIKCLLVLHLENCQAMSDDCNWYSHQTLLGKSLDVVQEEILYVKSHNVREIIQFVTYTVIRHCLASL